MRKLIIMDVSEASDEEITVQVIDRHSNEATKVIESGQALKIEVWKGVGLVIECRDAAPADSGAKVLGDAVMVQDGGA